MSGNNLTTGNMRILQETGTENLLDEDGYPTDFALERIRSWEYTEGWNELFEFIKPLWAYSDMEWWSEEHDVTTIECGEKVAVENVFYISTVGWSGNESIIRALESNKLFWWDCWYQHRRGGHYIFRVRKGGYAFKHVGEKYI